MTVHDFSSTSAVEDLRGLKFLSVLSAEEEFGSEEEIVGEVLAGHPLLHRLHVRKEN